MGLEKNVKKGIINSKDILKALDMYFVPTSFIREQRKSEIPLKNEVGKTLAYIAIGIAEFGRLWVYKELMNTITGYFFN